MALTRLVVLYSEHPSVTVTSSELTSLGATHQNLIGNMLDCAISAGVDACFIPRLRWMMESLRDLMTEDEFALYVAMIKGELQEDERPVVIYERLVHTVHLVLRRLSATFEALHLTRVTFLHLCGRLVLNCPPFPPLYYSAITRSASSFRALYLAILNTSSNLRIVQPLLCP